MTRPTLDDSRLLDALIENREDETRARLEPDARRRLEELKHVYQRLRDAGEAEPPAGLSAAQMEAVIRRLQAGPRAAGDGSGGMGGVQRSRWKPMAAAAAVLLLAMIAWSVWGPTSATDSVRASVFGGFEIVRAGQTIRPVDHGLRIRAGDVLTARGGGEINLGAGYLLQVARNTRLACLQIARTDVVLQLRSGRFRCEAVPPGVTLTLLSPSFTLTARDAVFSVQYLCREDDQLVVDRGQVRLACRGKEAVTVTPRIERFSLIRFCPCGPGTRNIDLEPCHKAGPRPEPVKSYPTQTDPERALALARADGVPVLVRRDDGPSLAPCYTHCCFVDFNRKRRSLCGVVWLVLDPRRQRAHLVRYNLDRDPAAVVVLDSRGSVVDRGRLETREGTYAAILNLIRAGKKACGR